MQEHEPVWTAENMNKKKGDTTLKTCGWCNFIGGGSCRYSCYLSGNCTLLKEYHNGVQWDSECRVMKLSKNDIPDIIRSKKYKIENAIQQVKDAKWQIASLKRIAKKLTDRPAMADSREKDFNEGDVIYVMHEKKWHRGIVVPGYRSHDGCVSYVLDDYPESAKGWGCGVSVPCVLSKKAFEWFLNHDIEHFNRWIQLQDREYNGERLGIEDYIYAMKQAKHPLEIEKMMKGIKKNVKRQAE